MTEMQKLVTLLDEEHIPYEISEIYGTAQVFYPSIKSHVCDAICHSGSYGYADGLLEIMGLTKTDEDDVEGWLTAEEVFNRMKQHYHSTITI